MADAKIGRIELIEKVNLIVTKATNEPADELIAAGKALQNIGETLKGKSAPEAVAILRAVMAIHGVDA